MVLKLPVDHQLREKCAVFGVYGAPEASRLTCYGLWALQHRGQEASGIVSSDGKRLYRHTGMGLVANIYHEEDLEQLPGSLAIGHNRYSTSGGADSRHNQPFVSHHQFAFAHNGNLPILTKLDAFLKKRGVATAKLNDSGMMSEAIACLMQDGHSLEDAVMQAFPLFQGAFSIVMMDADKLIALRDECGIRPLVIGRLGQGYVVASETCALDTIDATYVRDVEPGELVVIDKNGLTSHQLVKPRPKLDIFEMIYFARPDSQLLGKSVYEVRKNLGRELAKEFKAKADLVIPVPDSSIPMALGFAEESGLPFEMGLIKNRYIHRTFIRPSAKLRKRDVRLKLNPIVEKLRGKRVILIDDSIVRGTTMQQVTEMMYGIGVKELHILVSCPPVRYPDFYGINTPNQEDLIAARMSVEDMRVRLKCHSLYFLSFDGMIRATELPVDVFCASCFTGDYPLSIGDQAKKIIPIKANQFV
jgi:amidophosphoribosyltransferase